MLQSTVSEVKQNPRKDVQPGTYAIKDLLPEHDNGQFGKKKPRPTHKLVFDERERIYSPVRIPAYERD